MKEQLISFDTVKLAKEKGFDIPVRYGVYGKKMKLCEDHGFKGHEMLRDVNWNGLKSRALSVPTQSLLQKWLREKHNIHVCIENGFDIMLKYNRGYCLTINGENIWNNNDCFEQYEQALEKGLQEALKLIEL